ncbi:cobyrinate a,c-diamide synthase [Aureivirga sp. CE67]|uniref:cobyrinate a,c-diamide synthase n=1 Tax=Aureivirga sp. CE67 TaxID=1788983 RepID=UPI0018C9BE54|nr:cobyrinate a,c-diamide synthase [Aureivirga sp. CE67]
MKQNNRFMIAAPWSNSGKTTLTLGFARYFKQQNKKVQLFKCGPDYIDTIHHTKASGLQSINLDSVMMSEEHVKEQFEIYGNSSEISIVEGVMGLFDGAKKDKGSAAEISKLLNLPLILVVPAKAIAYSVAPLLFGLKNFDKNIQIAGVIFNFVNSESHFSFLKEACEDVGIPCFGYLPTNEKIQMPSRHLGLKIDQDFEDLYEEAASHLGKHLDFEAILKATNYTSNSISKTKNPSFKQEKKIKIAIAQDAAFQFTYHENIKQFQKLGEVTFFSPLKDKKLPEADLIYLAGGYPELYLEQLAKNIEMKNSIRNAFEKEKRILAECGGMMYLGKEIVNAKGEKFEMCGIFDFETSMENKKLHLGYRNVVFENFSVWGHEFHYSNLGENTEKNIAEIFTSRERKTNTDYFKKKNCTASYVHLYWGEKNTLHNLVYNL